MSHLLAIAVGPVQEFIAAARRTRDLWFGSYLLSEISRAVAKSVEADQGKLIFPAYSDAENVANVILVELPSGEPREVAARAKQAAQRRWLAFVDDAWNQAKHVICQQIWDEQKDEVIEFYAAWVPHNDPKQYPEDRKTLMRLLAGRKNCRDFKPQKFHDAGVPKSSLDGQRSSVFVERNKYPVQLRIRNGEQLDIVGLVKRVAEGNKPYPSVSRVASDPWVRGNKAEPQFQDLLKLCAELPSKALHRLDTEVFTKFVDFPYEGTALYRSRHHEWKGEFEAEDHVSLSFLQETLGEFNEPSPYLAVLVADGDSVGAAISVLTSSELHREFSQALAGFAVEAKRIVNDHYGVLVYAGGDDVLAFVPVDKCLSCARELRNKFVELLKDYETVKDLTPTLSVGIAIGHFMENLEDLLEYGRDAEKAAKMIDGKDALAVHLHKRGGSPITIVDRWKTEPDVRLCEFATLFNKGILPSNLPYELRQMATLYEGWPKETVNDAIEKDLARLIAKKLSKGVETVQQKLGHAAKNHTSKTLMKLAEEMLVARLLASIVIQATPKQTVEVRS